MKRIEQKTGEKNRWKWKWKWAKKERKSNQAKQRNEKQSKEKQPRLRAAGECNRSRFHLKCKKTTRKYELKLRQTEW